jgi:hypothetical protein
MRERVVGVDEPEVIYRLFNDTGFDDFAELPGHQDECCGQ